MSTSWENEQKDQEGRIGQSDHPQHRAGEGEGVRAPFAQETGEGPIQQTVFDGSGNEVVVATATNEKEGRIKQGTGYSAEEAIDDAKTTDEPIGEGFGSAASH